MGFFSKLFGTGKTYKATCVPRSAFCAWTYEQTTKLPARIVITEIKPGYDHAQAQGWDGLNWVWLEESMGYAVIKGGCQHKGREYKWLTIGDLLKEHEGRMIG